MSLQILSQDGSKYDPVFLKILEDIPGGVTVKTDRFKTVTTEIKKGALLNVSAASVGLVNLVKNARLAHAVLGDTGATLFYIDNPHEFKVGDALCYRTGDSSASILYITEGSVSAAIVVNGTIAAGAMASGATLFQAAAQAASVQKYFPNAILRNTIQIRKDGVTTLLDNIFAGAVVRGTVDESELPYFVTAADKTSLTDRIRFA